MNFSTKSITSVILIVAAFAVGYFVLLPRWDAYSQVNQVLAAKNQEKEKLAAGQAQLNNFLNDYKQHSDDARVLNQALPLSQSQLYNVLNSLDVLTKQSGLALGTISIESKPETDTLGSVSNSIQPVDLAFTLSGNYAAFKHFLTSLENNLRIMDITSLSAQVGEIQNTMTFNISFRTYYQK